MKILLLMFSFIVCTTPRRMRNGGSGAVPSEGLTWFQWNHRQRHENPIKFPSFEKPTVLERENHANSVSSKVCLTKGCVKAAAALIERMDDAIDPCEDFFQFSCGNFVKYKFIPDEKSQVTMFTEVKDELDKKMRILIEAPISSNDSSSTLMVKKFYASCMNTTRIEMMGLQPLVDILNKLGGWPVLDGQNWSGESNFSWAEASYIGRRHGYSPNYLFDTSVNENVRNTSWRILWFDQPNLGMAREYLIKGLEDKDVRAYLKYSIDVAVLLGANQAEAEKQMKDQLLFAIELAKITLPREKRRNITKLYNLYSVEDLQSLLPDIPWITFLNTILPPAPQIFVDEIVGVSDISYLKNMTKILAKTPKRVLANYILWRVAASSINFLSDDIRNIRLEFEKEVLGTKKREPRWKECTTAVTSGLSLAASNLYTKNHFNEGAKAEVEEMVRYLRSEFDSIIMKVNWMDEVTRHAALSKAAAITTHIAYPKELLIDAKLEEHYKTLKINDEVLLEDRLAIARFSYDERVRKLRERVDKLEWKRHANAAVVNAFYNPVENSIKFPAGILQEVFFEDDRPKYMNFGGIGYVIGHEITHGFDDQGKQFDSDGNLHNWWQPSTEQRFLKKAKCMIYQYGNLTAPENGLKVNGINTQGENIADNGGVLEAYHAYQNWVRDNGCEKTLPGLNYSTRQLFWLSASQGWCSVHRPEALKQLILAGVHSPSRFRVNIPLSNSEEFSRDWGCATGTKMNPINKCSVW